MKLYNTLNHKKEEFKPIEPGRVGLYTCGPTVYNLAHIGNFRAYITADVLQRTLRFLGYNVRWVMNITDIDDKTIRDSGQEYSKIEPMLALKKFTKKYEDAFWMDLGKLNIRKNDFLANPRATETIDKMQKLVKKILDKGYGYIKDGSVYFNVKKYAKDYKYGQLLTIDMKEFRIGARIDADEYEKENVQDFVLWKGNLSTPSTSSFRQSSESATGRGSSRSSKKDEPSWDFKIGSQKLPGRPGWHIECSAMSEKFLGKKFDIHTGGIDLKFPHHENEIAQSTIGFGTAPVNFWLHNEYLMVDGGKMSKSKNNFYILADLEKRDVSPLALRYLNLTASYRVPLNFTWKSLSGAKNALEKLYEVIRKLKSVTSHSSLVTRDDDPSDQLPMTSDKTNGQVCQIYRKRFLEAMSDDLDMPRALAVTWGLVKDAKKSDAMKLATLIEFDKVLGLGLGDVKPVEIPGEVKKLVKDRELARKKKDWRRADELRREIEKMGFGLEDEKGGTKILRHDSRNT